MQMIIGTALSASEQAYALAAYVHRFTGDHKPEWANKPWKDGKPYPVQFSSDADWLAHTYFPVTTTGRISRRNDAGSACDCHPTWPDNPELRSS